MDRSQRPSEEASAIKEGSRTPALGGELSALAERKAEREAKARPAPTPPPLHHPKLANVYRDGVAKRQEDLNLNQSDVREEAGAAIRSAIEENGQLEIEITGPLAALLDLAADSKRSATYRGPLQTTLVAGNRNQRYFGLNSARVPQLMPL